MNVLSRSELKQMLDQHQDFLLLNVLSPSSFQAAHIPNSKNIPVSDADFVKKVEHLLGGKEKNYPIVTYCGGFQCNASKNAANLLIAADHTQVSAFEGGMEDWLAADYPTTSQDTAACETHCTH